MQLTSIAFDISLCLFHLDLLSPLGLYHLDGVLEHEDGVEDGDGGEPQVDPKEGNVSKDCSYASAKGATDHEAKASDGGDEAKPGSSRLNGWHIRDVARDRKVEDGGTSCQVLEALKQDELNLELHEPDGVDDEDEVEDEEADEGGDDEGLPAIGVRERPWRIFQMKSQVSLQYITIQMQYKLQIRATDQQKEQR